MNLSVYDKKLFANNIRVLRAIEIAKISGESVCVIIANDNKNGVEEYKRFKEICKETAFFDSFSDTGLFVEFGKINGEVLKNKMMSEEIDVIKERVERCYLNNVRPELVIDEQSRTILNTILIKFEIPITKGDEIIKRASYIAMLDNSKKINIEHVIEAFHYSFFVIGEYYKAESPIISFGDMILIKRGDIDIIYIDQAIEYLTQLR